MFGRIDSRKQTVCQIWNKYYWNDICWYGIGKNVITVGIDWIGEWYWYRKSNWAYQAFADQIWMLKLYLVLNNFGLGRGANKCPIAIPLAIAVMWRHKNFLCRKVISVDRSEHATRRRALAKMLTSSGSDSKSSKTSLLTFTLVSEPPGIFSPFFYWDQFLQCVSGI